jgi:hypothetical protein
MTNFSISDCTAWQVAEGNRGGSRVRKVCDWDRVTDRYLELVAKLRSGR